MDLNHWEKEKFIKICKKVAWTRETKAAPASSRNAAETAPGEGLQTGETTM